MCMHISMRMHMYVYHDKLRSSHISKAVFFFLAWYERSNVMFLYARLEQGLGETLRGWKTQTNQGLG